METASDLARARAESAGIGIGPPQEDERDRRITIPVSGGAADLVELGSGTAAKTRVLITSGDGVETWGTVGVADNIIEASWQALVDSVEYKLRADGRRA